MKPKEELRYAYTESGVQSVMICGVYKMHMWSAGSLAIPVEVSCFNCAILHSLSTFLAAQARGNAYFGAGTGRINMDNVRCTGIESSLTSCPFVADHNCVHSEDASVICGEAECTKGDIRLINGSTPYEGLVQVCYNGVWGTVCDDYWGTNDAMVACRQLGFSPNSMSS